MQVTISKKDNNELLGRMEISGSVTFAKETPNNTEIAKAIGKQLGKDATLVVPKHIYTKFGHLEADFEAFCYNDNNARNKVEKKTKFLRKKAEESAKKLAEEKKAAEEAKAKEAEEKAAALEKATEENAKEASE
jgi:ribosomal protein S24E